MKEGRAGGASRGKRERGYEKERIQQMEEENKPPVLVVLAANEAYVPVLYTCVQSAVRHTSAARTYQFWIFHTNISRNSQEQFARGFGCSNIQICFFNVAKRIAGYQLKAKQHITEETFYRFLILDLCREYPKVVYLDCDTIVCRDLAGLYDVSVEDVLAAAVRDADFAGQCSRKGSDMRRYSREVLGLHDPFGYFQAGVLVLNVDRLRKVISVTQLLKLAETGVYRFSDQDILNKVCRGNVRYLDMAWNVLHDCGHSRWAQVIRYAPEPIAKEYASARKAPYIIHYAGYPKPWIRPDEDFAYEFWQEARQTVFYRQLLDEMCRRQRKGIWKAGRKAWFNGIKIIAKKLLPQGSRLRNGAIRLYLRIVA